MKKNWEKILKVVALLQIHGNFCWFLTVVIRDGCFFLVILPNIVKKKKEKEEKRKQVTQKL